MRFDWKGPRVHAEALHAAGPERGSRMKREGTWGAAAGVLALLAAVGISIQPGSRQTSTERSYGRTAPVQHSGKKATACDNLQKLLEDFLDAQGRLSPTPCDGGKTGALPSEDKTHLKFVIASLPDPLHTHLGVSFDESVAAVQEAAQDEGYDFDSSWLPWQQQEEKSYSRLDDQETAEQKDEEREYQPGMLLFRKSDVDRNEDREPPEESTKQEECRNTAAPKRNEPASIKGAPKKDRDMAYVKRYRQGLVLFVVGEDATHGIHRRQFRNALDWIDRLTKKGLGCGDEVAILGPSFSGSFASLAELFSNSTIASQLGLTSSDGRALPVYAGGVSGLESATWFQHLMDEKYGRTAPRVLFHSFVANDDQIVARFLHYMEETQQDFNRSKVAILSEDETAYGEDVMRRADSRPDVLRLFYPRDISAVRGAYQTKSLFGGTRSEETQNPSRTTLPSDLADPAGIVHDSVHTYGANQTPLAQEAFLLQIVLSLRERGVRYVLLRGSNPLDQLFLTDFLRRLYPDARIVIVTSDLLFIRERGATGLSGVMTLSTYPLSPLARQWTERPPLPANDRVFASDGSEGLYNAFRLLINADFRDETLPNRCRVSEPSWGSRHTWRHTVESDDHLFLPTVVCTRTPIVDYAPPLWIDPSSCAKTDTGPICSYPGPVVWLSVIGVNRFWPLVPLDLDSPAAEIAAFDEKSKPSQGSLALPLVMKLFLAALLGFSVFHAWCCWRGSYMAKPAFRAYFAASGDPRQSTLIWLGSSVVGYLGITAAWSCGVFARPDVVMSYPRFAYCSAVAVGMLAWASCALHTWRVDQLNPTNAAREHPTVPEQTAPAAPNLAGEFTTSAIYRRLRRWVGRPPYRILLALLFPVLSLHVFAHLFVVPLEAALRPENRVLTYWRSMNLWSGLSPVVPFFSLFIGLYVAFWYALHGLALFGPDRPRLPRAKQLEFQIPAEETPQGTNQTASLVDKDNNQVLRMFTQDAADEIEFIAKPMTPARRIRIRPEADSKKPEDRLIVKFPITFVVFVLGWIVGIGFAGGIPIRSLGQQNYAVAFLVVFLLSAGLMVALCWRMYSTWVALRQLLEYLDRLPLRRTMESLWGFSWGNVWKMSGNVLEVRYKLISRQLESMNHTIATLDDLNFSEESSITPEAAAASTASLKCMRSAGLHFAKWYLLNYNNPDAGDLDYFRTFQKRVATVCGCLLRNILLPVWRAEGRSLILIGKRQTEAQESEQPVGPQAKEEFVRNAEEFVCLTYMGFAQNILGRLRTMAVSVVALFVSNCVAISAYPFDPRQALSGLLIALFVVSCVSIVFVYAGMHRDATLSRVTNTTPGELGSEFWIKLVVFVSPPLLGLLARVFPGITDFFFAWLQPGLSSLK